MPTDFSKRLPGLEAREGRRGGTCVAEPRESSSRSVSPEKGRQQQHEDHRGATAAAGGGGGGGGGEGAGRGNGVAGECGRPDPRLGRRSPGSSPEPEDNSSTSGDEGSALLLLASFVSPPEFFTQPGWTRGRPGRVPPGPGIIRSRRKRRFSLSLSLSPFLSHSRSAGISIARFVSIANASRVSL